MYLTCVVFLMIYLLICLAYTMQLTWCLPPHEELTLAVLFLWLRSIERRTTHLTSIKHGHVTVNLPSAPVWGLGILRRLRLACWGFKLSRRGSFHSFHHVLALRRTLHVESEREYVFFFSIWIPEEFVWALNHQFTGSTNTGGSKADSRHWIKCLRGGECLTLPSNRIVNRKCPFVAFVLILLSAVTGLDTLFPHFTYNTQIYY